MPGLADLVPAQVQANSVGAVTNPNVDVGQNMGTLPEFQDFMKAYKDGIITADDIRKRGIVGTTGMEAEKAKNIADKAQSEQLALDINEVRPLTRELAKTQTQGAQQQATILNQMSSDDPAVAIPAQEAFVKRARQKEAILAFGTATPRLEVNQDITPASFEDWSRQEINNYRPGDNSQEANAARQRFADSLSRTGKETPEYKLYVKEAKSRTRVLEPGTQEYEDTLRQRVTDKLSHEKLQEIQFETLKEFGKAQAKVGAEGVPSTEHIVKAFNEATGKEETIVVRTDKRTGRQLSREVVGESIPSVTEFQGKTAGFHKGMEKAEEIIANLAPEFDPASWTTTAQGYVPNRFTSEQSQLYNTAKENWITAMLRHDSGAAITPNEFKMYKAQYFAKDGDTAAVVAKKADLRRAQEDILKVQAGPAGFQGSQGAPTTTAAPAVGPVARPTVEQKTAAQTFTSLAEVPTTVQFFKDPDGNLRVNPNFKP